MVATAMVVHAHFSSPDAGADTSALRRRLRQQLRQWRRELPDTVRIQHSQAVCRQILRHLRLRQPYSVSAYLAIGGEIDLRPALTALHRGGTRVALPVLQRHRRGQMCFRQWHPRQPLQRNRFGIDEPGRKQPRLWRRQLRYVLLPLLGFDAHGYRLGMGGGYYDRYFAARRHGQRYPKLIGVAYAAQQRANLPHEPWDVPLDGVVTEQGWHDFRPIR